MFRSAREHLALQPPQAKPRPFLEDVADFTLEFDGVEWLGDEVGVRTEHNVVQDSIA